MDIIQKGNTFTSYFLPTFYIKTFNHCDNLCCSNQTRHLLLNSPFPQQLPSLYYVFHAPQVLAMECFFKPVSKSLFFPFPIVFDQIRLALYASSTQQKTCPEPSWYNWGRQQLLQQQQQQGSMLLRTVNIWHSLKLTGLYGSRFSMTAFSWWLLSFRYWDWCQG